MENIRHSFLTAYLALSLITTSSYARGIGKKFTSFSSSLEAVNFNDYRYFAPFSKTPLFTEQLKRPAPATASRQVVVADKGAASISTIVQ